MVAGAGPLLHSSSRFPEFQHFRQTPFYTVRSLHDVLVDPFGSWAGAWSAYRPAFLEYLSVPLLVVTAAGVLLAWRRDPRLTALLFAWIALPLGVALTFASHPFPRYVLYVTPPMIVLMAYALVFAYAWARRRLSPAAASLSCVAAATLLFLPALRLDARILVDPATARYPGLDDRYVTGTSGGAAWPAVAEEIRQRAGGRRVVILGASGIPGTLRLLLGHGSRYVFVRGGSALAPQARFAVVDEVPFTDPQAFALMRSEHLVLIRRFARPRGGAVVELYERRP